MNRYLKNKWFDGIAIPFLAVFAYIGVSYIGVTLAHESILSAFIGDLLFTVIFGSIAILYWYKHRGDEKSEKLRFSIFGWLMIVLLFLFLYCTSQALGNYLGIQFPVGLTTTYTEMSQSELLIYVIMGVTVAPLAEELLFRWILFRHVRRIAPFWISTLVSAALFALFHFTIMHIPVAVGLTIFVCIFYEVTGNFLYCVLFHVLYNFMATTFLIGLDVSVVPMVIAYFVYLASTVAIYHWREVIFKKYLKAGGLEQFEHMLDESRKHFDEKIESKDEDKKV